MSKIFRGKGFRRGEYGHFLSQPRIATKLLPQTGEHRSIFRSNEASVRHSGGGASNPIMRVPHRGGPAPRTAAAGCRPDVARGRLLQLTPDIEPGERSSLRMARGTRHEVVDHHFVHSGLHWHRASQRGKSSIPDVAARSLSRCSVELETEPIGRGTPGPLRTVLSGFAMHGTAWRARARRPSRPARRR